MKRITIDVSDSKADFFEELIKSLDFVKIKGSGFDIPNDHKKIVLKRIKNSDSGKLVEWNKAFKKFHTK